MPPFIFVRKWLESKRYLRKEEVWHIVGKTAIESRARVCGN